MSGLEHLRPFAETERQHQYLDAIKEVGATHPSSEAAELLGVGHRNLQDGILRLKKKAALRGISNDSVLSDPINEAFAVKGTSTLYDEAGNVKIQWVKTDLAKEHQQEAFKDFIGGLCSEIEPVKPVPQKDGLNHDSELMSGIFIGDSHVGAKCHGSETKHSNFDTTIATKNTRDAVDYLISKAPNSETGLLVDVGDMTHANTSHDTTWAGTKLDVDTSHHVVMRETGMLMRYCIDRMLDKFKKVVVVVARGNHNPDAAIGVQLMLEFYYDKEDRVTILPTEGFFHYIEWGKWLFGINHGDKLKPQKLASVMSRDMAQAWGRTSHRMWALGHVHHQNVIEVDGCIIQKFAALPPPDSWHASMGFSSGQAMQMINFKKGGGTHSTFIYEIDRPQLEPDITID